MEIPGSFFLRLFRGLGSQPLGILGFPFWKRRQLIIEFIAAARIVSKLQEFVALLLAHAGLGAARRDHFPKHKFKAAHPASAIPVLADVLHFYEKKRSRHFLQSFRQGVCWRRIHGDGSSLRLRRIYVVTCR